MTSGFGCRGLARSWSAQHAAERRGQPLRGARVEDVLALEDLGGDVLESHDADAGVIPRGAGDRAREDEHRLHVDAGGADRREPAPERPRRRSQRAQPLDATTVDDQLASLGDEITLERTRADDERTVRPSVANVAASSVSSTDQNDHGSSRSSSRAIAATSLGSGDGGRRANHRSSAHPTPRPVMSARSANPKQMNDATANGAHGLDLKFSSRANVCAIAMITSGPNP